MLHFVLASCNRYSPICVWHLDIALLIDFITLGTRYSTCPMNQNIRKSIPQECGLAPWKMKYNQRVTPKYVTLGKGSLNQMRLARNLTCGNHLPFVFSLELYAQLKLTRVNLCSAPLSL